MLRYLSFVGLVLLLTGCASALKKQCESTNWFEHGKGVALSGRRLNSDDFAQRCQKEDVPVDYSALDVGFKSGMSSYCKQETVYSNGRNGVDFNPDLCDGSDIKALRSWHDKGIREYCQADNGYREGAKGEALKKICPPELASEFEKKHSQGRVVYLRELANQKEREIQLLSRQERDYSHDLGRKQIILRSLPFVSEPEPVEAGKTPKKLSNRERAILNERESLDRQIFDLRSKVEQLRDQQRTLQQQVSEHRSEATALSQAPQD